MLVARSPIRVAPFGPVAGLYETRLRYTYELKNAISRPTYRRCGSGCSHCSACVSMYKVPPVVGAAFAVVVEPTVNTAATRAIADVDAISLRTDFVVADICPPR